MPGLGRSLYREASCSSSDRLTCTGHEYTCITTPSVTHACSAAMRVLSTFCQEHRLGGIEDALVDCFFRNLLAPALFLQEDFGDLIE